MGEFNKHDVFKDQFAFKPRSSTTGALVTILHWITFLLEKNRYVRCLLVDYEKAFDKVDRSIALQKLMSFQLNPYITRWIAEFLSDRQQAVKIDQTLSRYSDFNTGIIQGSGLGPALFAVMISDLKPISDDNPLIKFADDISILNPENSDTELYLELDNVKNWANRNNMCTNLSKSKEIVFRRPSPYPIIQPPALCGIERITACKILGVQLQDDFRFTTHVNTIVSSCNQRLFLLKSLKAKGLDAKNLSNVFNAIVLGRVLYAISTWGGFINKSDTARIDSIFKKGFKYGFTPSKKLFPDLLHEADKSLFKAVTNSNHPLHSLLPAIKKCSIATRAKNHLYPLPQVNFNNYKNSFIVRSLFNFL